MKFPAKIFSFHLHYLIKEFYICVLVWDRRWGFRIKYIIDFWIGNKTLNFFQKKVQKSFVE
ncbi:hypothetical protein CDL10_01185 [Avrilella dinanensis]|uniref:Uncharacterized protein n=1 Tax=Avrilella dinanensis TaxID=2008672 RepID=A0A2M9R3F4_9FLAO|nr:hypothetical protein CDL10_01185 [Avrilella dinanensis]